MRSISSRADVPTDAPARYAKPLVAHLGRRLTFTTDGARHLDAQQGCPVREG